MKTLLTAECSGSVSKIEKTWSLLKGKGSAEQSQISPDFHDSTTLGREKSDLFLPAEDKNERHGDRRVSDRITKEAWENVIHL